MRSFKHATFTILTIVTIVVVTSQARATEQMPPGMTHEQHMKQLQKDAALQHRGATTMGFDQAATTHRFRLAASGGVIEVTVKDPADDTNRQSIRAHLKAIAEQFAAGDFGKPLMIHAEAPDGVSGMTEHRGQITYTFGELPNGGYVRIETEHRTAREAVHRFLRYQIREHKTGDPLTVVK